MPAKLMSRWRFDESLFVPANSVPEDVILGFFQDGFPGEDSSVAAEEEEDGSSMEESRSFWGTQTQLLEATLYRTSSLETQIRQATKCAVKEIKLCRACCTCRNRDAGGCYDCLRRGVALRLRDEGYNCSIRKSKWKTTPSMPAGEHTYLEVVENSRSTKGETRIIIEVNFRPEFQMARGNAEYNQLIERLPEVYVGRVERLKDVIKIVCAAAKRCMKEKNMHLGPWRKHKYMQCKWVGISETTSLEGSPSPPPPLPGGYPARGRKPKSSMLTYDLLNTVVLQPTAVKVL